MMDATSVVEEEKEAIEAGFSRRLDVAGTEIGGTALAHFFTAAKRYVLSMINVPKNGTMGFRAGLALNPRLVRPCVTPFKLNMSSLPPGAEVDCPDKVAPEEGDPVLVFRLAIISRYFP
jgi:hypothetical protein